MNTTLIRIPLDTANLENAITSACDLRLLAGQNVQASFVSGTDLVLIFQPPMTPSTLYATTIGVK